MFPIKPPIGRIDLEHSGYLIRICGIKKKNVNFVAITVQSRSQWETEGTTKLGSFEVGLVKRLFNKDLSRV